MRIIKPYGRTRTVLGSNGKRTRALHRHLAPDTSCDIVDFAHNHSELVLAQWISAIDKIIRRPQLHREPSELQWRLRTELSDAAFAIIKRAGLVPDLENRGEVLRQRWEDKLHPYGDRWFRPKDPVAAARALKGRWYVRFDKKDDPDRFDAAAVAEAIHRHLYDAEARLGRDLPDKRRGRIAGRAESIRSNIAAPDDLGLNAGVAWGDAEWQLYAAPGDVSSAIREAARQAFLAKRPMTSRISAPIFYAHYARLFPAQAAGALGIAQARAERPALLALHLAICVAYREIFRSRRKDLGRILPQGLEQLRRLLERKQRNKRLNALVRLGRVIHYSASDGQAQDKPGSVLDHWPADVSKSRFWLSDGQAEIKRSEAFVRIWRGILARAARTASDWADPAGRRSDDVLGSNVIDDVAGAGFDEAAYAQKLRLLFGRNQDLFSPAEIGARKAILRFALQGLAGLRNHAFHFKGRGGFTHALTRTHPQASAPLASAIAELWERDLAEQPRVLKAALATAHCEAYLRQEQLDRIAEAIVDIAHDHAPLPRFQRVLQRTENAWRKRPWLLALPAPANRVAMQNPVRRCQYVTLKLLYDRAFPDWLGDRDAEWINALIDRAIARTTQAARVLTREEDAVARATDLVRLSTGETIDNFIDRLIAATATEFRVQRGYDLSAEDARLQAKYLDDFRCDIVAQAFEAWLEESGFDYLLYADDVAPLPTDSRSNVDALALERDVTPVEPWALRFYFLLHLVPIGEVAKLQHQLRKWRILQGSSDGDVVLLERVLGLYVDVGDSRFREPMEIADAGALPALFERPTDFGQVLRSEDEEEGPGRYRGMREMLRFGDLSYMMAAFRTSLIETHEIAALCWAEAANDGTSPIARAQAERERLHALWVERRKLSVTDLRAYASSLDMVVWHRQLSARVRLNDHVRAHQLTVSVLSRMLDFAGLWERDLYFTSLALIHLAGRAPQDVYDAPENIRTGQIVKGTRSIRDDAVGTQIKAELSRLFGRFDSATRIRNDLAHFNMLRRDASLCLTEVVNRTRALMTYDRKLRNAVSQSVIELLDRNGLKLRWSVSGQQLESATIASRQAQHLRGRAITENLHGPGYIAIIASLFGGSAKTLPDITTVDPFSLFRGERHTALGDARRPNPARSRTGSGA